MSDPAVYSTSIPPANAQTAHSSGLFYILIVLLALACTPATLGCCWGKSLYDSPMMNGAPVGGYVAYPAATVQATTAYGGRATGGGYK